MSEKYASLMQPLVLPNGKILRNRVTAAAATNNFIQTTLATYPMSEMITMIVNRAKNGAAMVTLTGITEKGSKEFYHNQVISGAASAKDFFTLFDLENDANMGKFCELTEAIHMENSKIILQLIPLAPNGYDLQSGFVQRFGQPDEEQKEITPEMFDEIKARMVKWAGLAKRVGFDGVLVHMCYQFSIAARMLSLRSNHRTDEYGGSLENRCRWPLQICDEIKKACGKEFIVEAVISGNDPAPDGWSVQDSIAFTKMAEGKVDLIQIRNAEIDPSHPTGYSSHPYPMMQDAADIKAGGVKIPIETIGGYNDLDVMEDVIASGKADIIATARSWISNPEFGKCITEGRGEDVIPCIRCNKCHSKSMVDPVGFAATHCSVNPLWGLEHRADQMFDAPAVKRSVGIVGGGPIGMRAAITAADRGHDVTIYEKSDRLGGLVNCVDGIHFKWPLTKYKDWLIAQVEKRENITVKLNTEATKDLLKANGHEKVIVSVGSVPVAPPIPGIENAKSCVEVMQSGEEVAKDVVIIGGGDVGIDCGMDLAEKGHNVLVIEITPILAGGTMIMHTYSQAVGAWSALPTFKTSIKSRTTRITSDSVTYVDGQGEEHTVAAGTVLYATGMKPATEESVALADSAAYETFFVGDCNGSGDLQRGNRQAYGAAMRI
ncbi:MAG: FAD-dependent oxidoreductase [Lachnospiraceae bacterium]|nr:FAD-dependent oxidoreductase [Lachnospiraceae bacterium]